HRPPPEFGSVTVQATVGCPYNKCAFCGTFKETKFRIRSVSEICEDIQELKGSDFKGLFLSDGNSIVMDTDDLLKILSYAYEVMPNLKGVSSNASAKQILRKGACDLKELKDAGLKKIYMGLETGDEKILKEMNKGVTTSETIEASKLVKDSGIELSQTIIVGLGGRLNSKRHALATASILNEIKPDQIRLHTLTPIKETELGERISCGEFEELTPEETLEEMAELITALEVQCEIISHRSNYITFKGRLPEGKTELLSLIEYTLSPEGRKSWAAGKARYNMARLLFEFRRMFGDGRKD
ncbi:MAG: radical SAM protein, partial [Halobacteriota archaeon]|nr:radical SAM protein [Halobacteriota archaeon]